MNEKESFDKWHFENISNPPTLNDLIEKAWKAACEYKQKEIDELRKVFDMERYISSEYRRAIHEVLNSSNPNAKLSPSDAKFLLTHFIEMSRKPAKSPNESSPRMYFKMKAQREKLQDENAKLRKLIKDMVNVGIDYEISKRIEELGEL